MLSVLSCASHYMSNWGACQGVMQQQTAEKWGLGRLSRLLVRVSSWKESCKSFFQKGERERVLRVVAGRGGHMRATLRRTPDLVKPLLLWRRKRKFIYHPSGKPGQAKKRSRDLGFSSA